MHLIAVRFTARHNFLSFWHLEKSMCYNIQVLQINNDDKLCEF